MFESESALPSSQNKKSNFDFREIAQPGMSLLASKIQNSTPLSGASFCTSCSAGTFSSSTGMGVHMLDIV